MKTLLLALPITFGLVACANTTPDSNSSMTPPTPTTKTPVTVENPAMDMANAPCHQMPDGSWMGNCDETQPHEDTTAEPHDHDECTDDSCPMPETTEDHPHEDGMMDDHSMMTDTEEDHAHEDGVADVHAEVEVESHDDTNEPPHRH
jgi:hypothetical protein